MSAQKNTLFKYFGKSPAASPSASSAAGTPKTSKVTDSPSTTPKRALAPSRGGAQDSPKSTKSVRKMHLVAASPRTRVQRRLLDAASPSPGVYEPRFLRNGSTPQKEKDKIMSPVFKALKEHEESIKDIQPTSEEQGSTTCQNSSGSEEVVISPSKCRVQKTVRNLNREFVLSPLKPVGENVSLGKATDNCGKKIDCPEINSSSSNEDGSELSSVNVVDVNVAFGLYVAEEMRRLHCDKAKRNLKKKIMKAILDVQAEQENKK